ncbi:MAG: hypothetical protein WCJ60_02270 [bacterium]
MTKYEQYLICKERGHKGNGSTTSYAIANSPVFQECGYCGTTFWTTTITEQHEKNAPTSN